MKKHLGIIGLILILSFVFIYYQFSVQANGGIYSDSMVAEAISYRNWLINEDFNVIDKLKKYSEELKYNISNIGNDDGIPILIYHHISKDPNKLNSIVVSPKKFEEDMLYLKVMGYNTIHFKDYLYYKETNNLPSNPIIITFDDGYKSNYKYAYPILKELNMKATISVIGNFVGRKKPWLSYFSWEEAKEMYDSGLIDIQHHSYDLHYPKDEFHGGGVLKRHNETQEEYEKRFIKDTLKLKELIESKIGNNVILYTYPYGFYTDRTEELLREYGFKFTVTVKEGLGDMDGGFGLRRINSPYDTSSIDLIKKLLRLKGRKEKIPFRDIKSRDERIKKLRNFLNQGENDVL